MSETKGAGRRKTGISVDTALVRELADILTETGLTEIEVEDDDRKIRVAREQVVAAPAHLAMAAAPAPAAAPAAPAPAEAPAAAGPSAADLANAVKSPMVGTVYLSGDPGSPPFVSVGDTVKTGDTLLIVEAMKVMNPITATKEGTVKEVLVGNAEPVEFDQPLVILG